MLLIAAAVLVVVLLTRPSPRRPAGRHPAPAGPVGGQVGGPALPAPSGIRFGASVNRLFNDGTASPQTIASVLGALRATGATLARSDALWEASEPTAPAGGVHTYDWRFDDTVAGDLAAAHLAWLPILDYSAPWAQSIAGQDHSPPSSTADYAAYAGAFAARYGTGGSFWSSHPGVPAEPVTAIEIWNEPDNPQFWTPGPDAGRYAELYLAARAAIDAVDPTARILVGGLVHPATFLPAMLRAVPALAGHVDGVAVHPYGVPHVVLTRIAAARAALRALGMGAVPLYVTEFGWTTSPPGAQAYAPAARRPGYIRTTLRALGHTDCGLATVVLYAWVTPELTPSDSGDWYGIYDSGADGPAPPDAAATAAFTAGLSDATAPGATRDVCPL